MSNFTGMAFTTVAVAVGSTELKRLADQKWNTDNPTKPPRELQSPMTPVFGGFVLGIFLFAFGMINEYLANLFCILIIIGALLINGTAAFSIIK